MARLIRTLHLATLVFMARTFGKYRHSVWDGQTDYAIYDYRGKTVYITTCDDEEQKQ